MPRELKHLDGSDSHSGTVCGWTEEVITVVVGSGPAACSVKPPIWFNLVHFLGFFILVHVDDITLSYHLLQSQRYIALKLST